MNSKKRHNSVASRERNIKPKIEQEELLPFDVWSIIMRFSDVRLLRIYTLLSKRYKKCVYSLSMDVLEAWVTKMMDRKGVDYRFTEHLGPEQLFSNIRVANHTVMNIRGCQSVVQLVYKNRVVVADASLMKKDVDSMVHPEMAAAVPTYIAYHELLYDNIKKIRNERLLMAIAISTVRNFPYLLRLFPELETLAISAYTKDEVLLCVYGGLTETHRLLFVDSWQSREHFRGYGYADDDGTAPDKLTFRNRTFVHVNVDIAVPESSGYEWCESTLVDSLATKDTNQLTTDSLWTVNTMLQLSRLKPHRK